MMKKPTKWQLIVISAVVILTIYNILPTLIFYSKPLDKPLGQKQAIELAKKIQERVNATEGSCIGWLKSYCNLIQAPYDTIQTKVDDPSLIVIQFKKKEFAEKFTHLFPRANAHINFEPIKASLCSSQENELIVELRRSLPISINENEHSQFFQLCQKFDTHGAPTPLYKALIFDRVSNLLAHLTINSPLTQSLQSLISSSDKEVQKDICIAIEAELNNTLAGLKEHPKTIQRIFNQLSFADFGSSGNPHSQLIQILSGLKEDNQKTNATSPQQKVTGSDQTTKAVDNLVSFLKKHPSYLKKTDKSTILSEIQGELSLAVPTNGITELPLKDLHPFIEKIIINWNNQSIYLQPYAEVFGSSQQLNSWANQTIYALVGHIKNNCGENAKLEKNNISIPLTETPQSQALLVLKTSSIAAAKEKQVLQTIREGWSPLADDLVSISKSLHNLKDYYDLTPEQKQFSIIVCAPAAHTSVPHNGLKMGSVYVIAKGLKRVVSKFDASPDSPQAKSLFYDLYTLHSMLIDQGFQLLPENQCLNIKDFSSDFIFEAPNYFSTLIEATREDFKVHGTKRYATLELLDVRHRIRKNNEIDTKIHDDLLAWHEDYRSAIQGIRGSTKYDVPKPTASSLVNNFLVSCKKYIRGDESKVLQWGLDLSGGKTVQIELLDAASKPVKDELSLKLGINELYQRINKLGVSEVAIRREGSTINIDFPNSQSLSASDLVKVSTMHFHVVNEKFCCPSSPLFHQANRFLKGVWQEAVATGKTSIEDLNNIALNHLEKGSPKSKSAPRLDSDIQLLIEEGLKLSKPTSDTPTAVFDTTLSKIAYVRNANNNLQLSDSHPLMIVFHNYALEGAHLDNVRASYDPSKGNYLSFQVKNKIINKMVKHSPQKSFYEWTSSFAKDSIAGSTEAKYTAGKGWRMAVILNDSIVSAPTLDSALQDSAMISGSFTQNEVLQLEQNLKAGSLTFTPKILSEKSISPELGNKERTHGITSTILALILVILCMVIYYRFSGFIASVAVCFNLLIMWATLQTIGATISLPMIAGLILTVGMAVDANVLVFERIKEELALGSKLTTSLIQGYKKAFTAIIDSNITTIIAAFVLLQFDSGPIKGFALTLIIGIISSMFTALFMTKFFFSYWASSKGEKKLTMLDLFKKQNFAFLKLKKKAFTLSAFVIVLGFAALWSGRSTLFGMDFTGGYSATAQLSKEASHQSLTALESTLVESGLSKKQFYIRTLDSQGSLKIFFSKSIDKKIGSFPLNAATVASWLESKTQKPHQLLEPLSDGCLLGNWTSTSGQMSDAMKNHALIGLCLSLVGILVYITMRFELKYAAAATLCLAHDLIFTVALIAILHKLGVLIQIDLNIIAALMTIIGYSLNDTIIIFDRIREESAKSSTKNFAVLVNSCLNATLSRTIMTSGTTLLVLLPMIFMGGSTIFGFSLVMAIGVVFGTLSSLFIAAPILLFFHEREHKMVQLH